MIPPGDSRSDQAAPNAGDQIRETAEEHDTAPGHPALDAGSLDMIISRVVEAAQPDRIILFGSAARGDAGPDSDIDLLVIKSGIERRGAVEDDIHMNLFGVGVPVDVIVVTPDDVEFLKDRVGSVIPTALKEGREIYAAPSE